MCSKDICGTIISVSSTEGLDPAQQVAYLDHNASRWEWAELIGMSIDERFQNYHVSTELATLVRYGHRYYYVPTDEHGHVTLDVRFHVVQRHAIDKP